MEKKTAEEYLKECVQGEGANEVVSYAEALYAVQLSEELLEELAQGDAVAYLDEYCIQRLDTSRIRSEYTLCENTVTIKQAKHALAIQEAKHRKEMEGMVNVDKAVEAFKKVYSCANGYVDCEAKFRKLLKQK